MTEIIIVQRMWQRRGTAAEWAAQNPVLAAGEIGVELGATASDPQRFKIGNGSTAWASLAWAGGGGGGGSTWYSAAGAPSAALGVEDDQYLNTSNGDVYARGPVNWTLTGNIRGPQGAQGPAGTPVEMRANGVVLQWRYVGSGSWTNLFDLSTLPGRGVRPLVTGDLINDQPQFVYIESGDYVFVEG